MFSTCEDILKWFIKQGLWDDPEDICLSGCLLKGKVGKTVFAVSPAPEIWDMEPDVVVLHHSPILKKGWKHLYIESFMKEAWERRVSLFAYHFPLDRHPIYSTSLNLAKHLGIKVEGWFGEFGVYGWLDGQRVSVVAGSGNHLVKKAFEYGDVFITGELKESALTLAQSLGEVRLLGHRESEVYGLKRLMEDFPGVKQLF